MTGAIGMRTRLVVLAFVLAAWPGALVARAATLGISADGRYFTLDGSETFLNGISYYGAQTISTPAFVTQDLDDMVACGFNWIRVWAYWTAINGEDVSVLTHDGYVRSTYMNRLKTLITECNNRGMMVDVSLNRDGAGTWVGARTQAEHLNAVRTLATELLPYRNVYIDVANERDVQDGRFVSLSECGQLIDAIKVIDPARLCTASSKPGSQGDLAEHRNVAHMDFITPHLCRDAGCAAQTVGTVKEFITWMSALGWRIPIHLQEPFRRGYGSYEPTLEDFLRDCAGGKVADAAGWCFHNGDNHDAYPYRSFDMSNAYGRMFAQFDSVELQVCNQMDAHIAGANPYVRRYQAEYDEHLAKLIGRRDGDGRSANVAQDTANYLSYGPYVTSLPADDYQVTWRMMVDNNTADNDAVVTIDVHDYDAGLIKASRIVSRQEFTGTYAYQDFALSFNHTVPGHRFEFRTYWHGRAYLKLDYIQVVGQQTPTAPVICEVSPDPDTAMLGSEYVRQLSLCAGYPVPTWSVQEAPAAGVQVSSIGQVSGWTPSAGDVGQTFTFRVRATNTQGDDDETWQVTVQSGPVPVFQDALQDSSLISGQIGGSFTTCGYRLNNRTDYIYYNLDGRGADGTGSMECDVTGLFPYAGAQKNHIMTTCDRDACCESPGGGACDPVANGWAIYSSNYMSYIRKIYYADPTYDNKMKLTGSALCQGEEQFTGSAYSWDGTVTYRFRMTWTNNRVRYYRGLPGQPLDLLKEYYFTHNWTPAKLHVQLGGTSIAVIAAEIGGAPGTCYSLFRVYEEDLGGQATSGGQAQIPPIIVPVTPDPHSAPCQMEYTEQLTLQQGMLPVSWSIVQAPSGAQVDQAGLVFGWTPACADRGQSFNFVIRASNTGGSTTESWQVTVTCRQDLDHDTDVDQADFGIFQRCLSGSNQPYASGCAPADLNGDGDVDESDFSLFYPCIGGSDNPPGC